MSQLCDSMDSTPTGSWVRGILQARILGVGLLALPQGIFPTQGSIVDSASLGPLKQS